MKQGTSPAIYVTSLSSITVPFTFQTLLTVMVCFISIIRPSINISLYIRGGNFNPWLDKSAVWIELPMAHVFISKLCLREVWFGDLRNSLRDGTLWVACCGKGWTTTPRGKDTTPDLAPIQYWVDRSMGMRRHPSFFSTLMMLMVNG